MLTTKHVLNAILVSIGYTCVIKDEALYIDLDMVDPTNCIMRLLCSLNALSLIFAL